jgi:hypothetical protein
MPKKSKSSKSKSRAKSKIKATKPRSYDQAFMKLIELLKKSNDSTNQNLLRVIRALTSKLYTRAYTRYSRSGKAKKDAPTPSKIKDELKKQTTAQGLENTITRLLPALTAASSIANRALPSAQPINVTVTNQPALPDKKNEKRALPPPVEMKPVELPSGNKIFLLPEDEKKFQLEKNKAIEDLNDFKEQAKDYKEKIQKASEDEKKILEKQLEDTLQDIKTKEDELTKLADKFQKDSDEKKRTILGMKVEKGKEIMAKTFASEWPHSKRRSVLSKNGIKLKNPSGAETEAEFKKTKEYKDWYDVTNARIWNELQSGKGSNKYGKEGLDTKQLDYLGKEIPGYQGAWPRDSNLPVDNKTELKSKYPMFSWIVNLDKSNEPGSHWVSVLLTPKSAEYYDSLAEPCPNDILEQILKRYEKIYNYDNIPFKQNLVKQQKDTTNTCGVFALMFIVKRVTEGLTFEEATGFKQQREAVKGENQVKEFEAKFPKFQTLHQSGSGIIDVAKDLFERVKSIFTGPRNDASPKVRKFLETNGDRKILQIQVVRDPVVSMVQKFVNFITLGAFDRVKQELNYDDVFHLFIQVKLDNNEYYTIQKNHVVEIDKINSWRIDNNMPVKMTKEPTIFELIKNGKRVHGDTFWLYDAKTNNCQDFILSLLMGSALLTPELEKFIKQDAVTIFKGMPGYAEKIAKFLTDTAGKADVVIHGKGPIKLQPITQKFESE